MSYQQKKSEETPNFVYKSCFLLCSLNNSLKESNIIDWIFLEGYKHPTIAILSEEKDGRQIQTYQLVNQDKEEKFERKISVNTRSANPNLMCAVSARHGGGFIMFADQNVSYVGENTNKSISLLKSSLVNRWQELLGAIVERLA